MPEKTDFTKADNSGISFGSCWGVIENDKLVNVIDERVVPSVLHRIFEESKAKPDTLYVLGRFIANGLSLKKVFLHPEAYNLVQNGKIGFLEGTYLDHYPKSYGIPADEFWVLMPDREEAYHQYVIMKKF
jgi:hypothetical protein